MRKNIIITGIPKSGKSTILKQIIKNLKNKKGFITNEILQDGKRTGFETETQSGKKSIIASINFNTSIKVSKYFVEIDQLDKIIPEIIKFSPENLLYIDEIGQMQLYSKKFKELTIKYLDSKNTCLATLSKVYSDKFTDKLKKRKDIILVDITPENRKEKLEYIEALIKKINKAKRYANEPNRFVIKRDKALIKTDHGLRELNYTKKDWHCNCDFFKDNNICSHKIALEEFLKNFKSH